MKNPFLFLILAIISTETYSQASDEKEFNAFSNKGYDQKYFVASNSGIRNTPLGVRIGILGKTGAYFGARFGKGEVYHSDSDLSTTKTNLFSLTVGIIKPVYYKNNFGISVFGGAGYGQWWQYRWERWTKSGYEAELGLMIIYKSLIINASGNVLNGDRTYATGDFTVGIGARF
jgi:hypothetical protein